MPIAKKIADAHICFIGDSFVNGAGDPDYLGWVGRLCRKSNNNNPSREISSYNLGVRGDTSIAIADRWLAESEVRLSQSNNPRLVFSFGVNDTVMQSGRPKVPFSQSVEITSTMLSEAKKRYPILMVGPPPITDPEQNERIHRLDSAFAKLCQDIRVDYLSVFQQLKNEQLWLDDVAKNDGSHPGAAGYTQFARVVYGWNNWWFKDAG